VTITVGQGSANVAYSILPGDQVAGTVPLTSTTPPASGGVGGPATGGTAADVRSASGGLASSSGGDGGSPALAAPPDLAATGGAASAPQVAGSKSNSPAALQALRAPKVQSITWIYLMVVLLAVATFGGATAMRLLGVRFPWSS
jgi:hypothetical protein